MYQYILDSHFSKKIFWIGTFFLASAPSLAFLFFLLSASLSIRSNFQKISHSKWNLIFIFSALMMPLICLLQSDEINPLKDKWSISLTWIGLTNWLPLIFCFLSFQFFVNTNKDRELFGKILIAGCTPVLISGFSQYFFKLYGPFEFLNGFIIWFQRPLQQDSGMTALFNNQNYAGAWLCIVWPFTMAAFLESFKSKLNKYICLSILISITFAILLTTSRSAWGGLILLLPLMTGFSSLFYLLPIFFIAVFFIMIAASNFVPADLQNEIRNIIPSRFWQEFIPENFIWRESRLEIWNKAIFFISKKPFFGWGAATFPVLYLIENNSYAAHAHNLILELSVSYGIPLTALIFISIFLIFIFSFSAIFTKTSFTNNNFFDKAWFSSFFILLTSQLVDIQYFDGRISIIFWILLAGLKETIEYQVSPKTFEP